MRNMAIAKFKYKYVTRMKYCFDKGHRAQRL